MWYNPNIYYWGMNWIWWAAWIILLIWIFAIRMIFPVDGTEEKMRWIY